MPAGLKDEKNIFNMNIRKIKVPEESSSHILAVYCHTVLAALRWKLKSKMGWEAPPRLLICGYIYATLMFGDDRSAPFNSTSVYERAWNSVQPQTILQTTRLAGKFSSKEGDNTESQR